MIWPALKMILALGGFLALLYFLVRLFKRWERKNGGPMSDGAIRVLTSRLIAPQKHISLVEIGGELFALGVTPQQITFLTRIENREMVKKSLAPENTRPDTLSWMDAWPLLLKKARPTAGGGDHGK